MLNIGKIRLRDIKELQNENVILKTSDLTPLRKRKNIKYASTSKKLNEEKCGNKVHIYGSIAATSTTRKTCRNRFKSFLKETPSNQKRIDSYFTSCPKSYDIKFSKTDPMSYKKSTAQTVKPETKSCRNHTNKNYSRLSRVKRKRLFTDSTNPSADSMIIESFTKANKQFSDIECIVIDTDSEDENKTEIANLASRTTTDSLNSRIAQSLQQNTCTDTTTSKYTKSITDTNSYTRRKIKLCPPYKVIENTTFAVDAFQYGYIDNVSHYFLTHFHSDHYIGLTKSFAMPVYMSPITARLLRKFIPVQEQYIHELELNQPRIVNDIEVTAVEANHCPGAILILFKFLNSGKCILHTGDFRASHEMESEPIFWNNLIHTLYLDTTYISDKYAFCTQYESIMKAEVLIEKFLEKHVGKRVLYICGSYIIGKEKFWSALAEKYEMKVWAEGNRYKALTAMDDKRLNNLLVTDPHEADMHVIPMGKLSYLELVEYFKIYEQRYDIVFAMRPSGWEKNAKPRYGAKINIVGIEYSEHSSYVEMQRFVKFLKPEKVISTVPTGNNPMETATVPISWYKYDTLKASSNYQPSLHSFFCKTPKNKLYLRSKNLNNNDLEYFVSPLKPSTTEGLNNNVSLISSKQSEAFIMTEGICVGNKKENLSGQSAIELQNNKNRSTNYSKSISLSNSWDDFEKSDIIARVKNGPRKNDSVKKKLHQRTENQLRSNNLDMKHKKVNVKIPRESNNKAEENNELASDNNKKNRELSSLNAFHYSSENGTIEYKSIVNETVAKTVADSQMRITRSKTKLTNSVSARQLEDTQATHRIKKNFKTKSPPICTRPNLVNKSIHNLMMDVVSNEEYQSKDNTTKPQDLDISYSLRRITKSKSASTEAIDVSVISNIKFKDEFDSKLIKSTQQNDQINSLNSKLESTATMSVLQGNPLCKSSTDSTVDQMFGDDKLYLVTSHSSSHSTNYLNHCDFPTNSTKNKSIALNFTSTPFKKAKLVIEANIFLNPILEKSEEVDKFDRLNCSQLSGLAVENVNKENPDSTKDHKLTELLSDADDDWM